jgi:hypothetical protein
MLKNKTPTVFPCENRVGGFSKTMDFRTIRNYLPNQLFIPYICIIPQTMNLSR